MTATIKLRRGTAAEWTTSNPVLAAGEMGVELDTNKHKIGDGTKTWTQLNYFVDQNVLSSTLVPKWQPNTVYSVGNVVMAPDGSMVKRLTSGTSGSSYTSTNWQTVATVAGTQAAVELSNAFTGHVNGFRDMFDKIRSQQQAVNLLIIGDSASDRTTGGAKWTTGLGAEIGALCPTHTVQERDFDYTITNDWLAATTVQTGTGYRSDLSTPPVLTVWVAGWSLHNWSDWLQDSRRDKVFGSTVAADVTVFALGHNDGTANMTPGPIRDRDLLFVEWIRTLNPSTQIVLCSQNVRPGGGTSNPTQSPGHAELRNDIYRSLARQRGYGYINITQAFHDDGRSLVPGAAGGLIEGLNGVHPSQPEGCDLWRSVFMRQIANAPGAVPLSQQTPALRLLTKRIVGMNVRPILSNGWTGTQVVEAAESVIVRGGSTSSIKLTKNSGQIARVDGSLPIAEVSGRDVIVTGWVYVPSSVADVKLIAGFIVNGSLVSSTLVNTTLVDQWYPIALSQHIDSAAASASVRLWVDNDTSADTPSVYVDRFDVLHGNLPMSAISETLASSGAATPITTWSALTDYTTGQHINNEGALYQATSPHRSSAAFRTDLAANLWTHVNGTGRVESFDPLFAASVATAWPGANRAYYYRVASAAAISNLSIEVGVTAAGGNIILAVFKNNGLSGRAAAPSGAPLATSGVVAVPAVGFAPVSLGATIGVAAGDWLMLACDNTTAKFRTTSGQAGASGLSTGRIGFENLASFVTPGSPGVIGWAPTYAALIVGS